MTSGESPDVRNMTTIIVVCLLACFIWLLSRKPKKSKVPAPVLNPICIHCGKSACVLKYRTDSLHFDGPMPCCDVICTACGKNNTSACGIEEKYRVATAIQQHNQQVAEYLQKKEDLRALLREATEQGVDPENFDQWLRSKGL